MTQGATGSRRRPTEILGIIGRVKSLLVERSFIGAVFISAVFMGAVPVDWASAAPLTSSAVASATVTKACR